MVPSAWRWRTHAGCDQPRKVHHRQHGRVFACSVCFIFGPGLAGHPNLDHLPQASIPASVALSAQFSQAAHCRASRYFAPPFTQQKYTTMPDDHSNTIAGATEISLGTSYSGTLDYIEDSDKFAINLIAGQSYRFAFGGYDMVRGGWLHRNLLDSDGNSVPGFDSSTAASWVHVEISGTYYLDVKHVLDDDEYDDFFPHMGGYSVQVQSFIDDYPEDTLPSDATVDIGETVTGFWSTKRTKTRSASTPKQMACTDLFGTSRLNMSR